MSDAPPPEGYAPLDTIYEQSFIAHIGPFHARPSDVGVDVAVFVRPQHCNPFGEVHGGFIAAMADFVCAYSMLNGPQPTRSVATVQLSTQMISSARLGEWIEARAHVRRKGRTIAHVGCAFEVGDRLIAHADAVFRVLSDSGVADRFQRREHFQRDT